VNTTDYNELEQRVLAHLTNTDIHTAKASEVFGVSTEHVTAEQRRAAKAMNYYERYSSKASYTEGL
jgi:DNA polymerase-1